MKFLLAFLHIFLISCDFYTPYKSHLIGKKFKTKNLFLYVNNLDKDESNCYGRVHKTPLWFQDVIFDNEIMDSFCSFRKSLVRAELVPIGSEFEVASFSSLVSLLLISILGVVSVM